MSGHPTLAATPRQRRHALGLADRMATLAEQLELDDEVLAAVDRLRAAAFDGALATMAPALDAASEALVAALGWHDERRRSSAT